MDKIDKSAIPYTILTREVPFKFGTETVKVCICLLDPLCTGTGLTREDALNSMIAQIDEKYDDEGTIR